MGIHMSSEKNQFGILIRICRPGSLDHLCCFLQDLQIVLFRFGKYLKQTSSSSDVLQLNREMSF